VIYHALWGAMNCAPTDASQIATLPNIGGTFRFQVFEGNIWD
jgi:hypothetical protein